MTTKQKIPVPALCRLEYLTPDGWVRNGGDTNLLHPARYVERLEAQKKFGRCTELDDNLAPTGRVYVSDSLPNPRDLVWPTDGTSIPRLPGPDEYCAMCDERHPRPHDGSCLI